jgi:4a-hydroxytetrahydrobiopterin dehydratase
MTESRLKRQEISDATGDLGWRLTLGELRTQVLTRSLAAAADVAARIATMAGDDAGEHLRMDVRADRVYLIAHRRREAQQRRGGTRLLGARRLRRQ